MELVGDETRIRALFSEVRFADGCTAPSFNSMWRRAESRSIRPRRAFNLSFVAATALLMVALASLAVWARYSRSREEPHSAFATLGPAANLDQATLKNVSNVTPPALSSENAGRFAKHRALRLAATRRALIAANRRVAEQAKQIATWKSPTASLLNSSSDDLLKTLPQLNENAAELKSFLPNSSTNKEN